jgi:photosystem II stability/assembly factor-like uncharacterized protein
MKAYLKAVFILCLILYLADFANAQEWQWSNPQPQGNHLQSVYFFDDNTGFAVGNMGTVLKTTDGGNHWDILYLPGHPSLYSIHFFGTEVGIITGENGTIFRTADEGETWDDRSIDPGHDLFSVYLYNSDTGYIVGCDDYSDRGILYKTTNGGETWTLVNTTSRWLYTVYPIGGSTVFAAGGDGIYRSNNGGLNWLDSLLTPHPIASLCFSDDDHGVAAGGGNEEDLFMITTNGGDSWNQIYQMPTLYYSSVFFSSALTGYAIGYSYGNIVMKTIDGGITWVMISSYDYNLNSLYFINDDTGYAVGHSGIIVKTTNGGVDWEPLSKQVLDDYYSIYFTGPDKGFVSGKKTIALTEDAGEGWEKKIGGNDYERLYQITFENENEGYASGYVYHTYYTKDGGNSWNTMSAGTWPGFYGIDIPPQSDSGYLIGESGNIVKFNTQISGFYWRSQLSPYINTSYDYLAVHFPARDTGFITGSSGIMIRTYNGGYPWETLNTGTSANLRSVYFPDNQTGYVVGDGGTILKTTNNGTTWTAQISGTENILYCVHFYNEDRGYIAGASGTILKTLNGGETWIAEESNTAQELRSVFIYDTNTVYVAGLGGTILKSVPGGFFQISEEELNQRSSISLFPNPLNNSSLITFEIQSEGMVDINLYDLSGKMTLSLLHGVMTRGKHQFRFYKGEIPSGVYFIRIISGNKADVLKFIIAD